MLWVVWKHREGPVKADSGYRDSHRSLPVEERCSESQGNRRSSPGGSGEAEDCCRYSEQMCMGREDRGRGICLAIPGTAREGVFKRPAFEREDVESRFDGRTYRGACRKSRENVNKLDT